MKHVKNTRRATLHREIETHVEQGTSVYTDALPSYEKLDALYIHAAIDHAKSYAEGAVHTNGMENFWSLLKRTIRGTYVSVNSEHLECYLDEQAFRFNERKGTDLERFVLALAGTPGRRLTYAELIGNTEAQ